MPTLPLPPGPNQLGGGDLPVTSTADVLAVLPAFLKPSDSAPVRDGLIAALTQMLITYQERAGYGAAQSDILRATEPYIQGLAGDRGINAQVDEDAESIRNRILSTPALVTPAAILAAVNAILAPFTNIKPQYFETIGDRWYVRDAPAMDDTEFHSFIYDTDTKSRSPNYPDRLYEDDAVANHGYMRAQSNPYGARVFDDTIGRYFVLLVPDLGAIDSDIRGVFDTVGTTYPPGSEQPGLGLFTYDSQPGVVGAFIRSISATAIDTYQAIVDTVDRIHAGSIRWELIVEPKLNL